MTVKQCLDLYSKRDEASKAEQRLEDDIFNVEKMRSPVEIDALVKEYQKLKDKRAFASLQAAKAYMQLTPNDRKKVTDQWAFHSA